MTAAFHVKLFGVPGLEDSSGRVVGLRTRKHLALLVYLTLEGRQRPVSREALIELFWPDVSLDRGRHSLSQALSTYRKHLGRDALSRAVDTVRLLGGVMTELDESPPFGYPSRDLASPLRGLDDCAGATFAHWLDGARQRCIREIRDRLRRELTDARTQGQATRVHERAQLLYAVDPLSDTAAHALAEDRLLNGDKIGAIRFLREHTNRTEAELGCNPNPEIERLLRRLEKDGGRGLATHDGNRWRQPGSHRPREVFVGREEELARLEALWSRTRDGDLVTCLVTGAAGIGKSALIKRFRASVMARTWPTFGIACQEIGRNIPFAAVAELVYQLAKDPAASATDPKWLAEASRVTPGLREIYPGIPEPPATPADAVRLRVAEALLQLIRSVSDDGPVLLAIDDLQHLDPASRDVLHVLLRRLDGLAAFMLAAERIEESGGLQLSSSNGDGAPWSEQRHLEPLDRARIRALVAEVAEGRDLPCDICEKVVLLAQGNPYLAEMLVSDWRLNGRMSLAAMEVRGARASDRWSPPATMRAAFARQHEGLSADAEHTLHLLAVAGREMPTTEIAVLLSTSPSRIQHATLGLLDRGVVCVNRGVIGFKNELHRAFVYYAMSESTRNYHHVQLAKSLIDSGGSDDFQRTLEASHHFLKAGMNADAVSAACRGADHAVTRGAPKEAERALRAILPHCPARLVPRANLLLARTLLAQGRHQEALSVLTSWSRDEASRLDIAYAAAVKAEALQRGRLASDAVITAAADEALALAQASGDERLLLRMLQVTAESAAELDDGKKLRAIQRLADRAVGATTEAGTRAMAQLTRGYCALMIGNATAAFASFRECVRQCEDLSLEAELRQSLTGLAMSLSFQHRHDESIQSYQRALRVADRIGDSGARANVLSNLAIAYEMIGSYRAAHKCLEEAANIEDLSSNHRRAVEVYTNLADVMLLEGYPHTAVHEMIMTAKEHAYRAQLWWLQQLALLIDADHKLICDEREAAWRVFEEAESLGEGRSYVLADNGRYGRLKIHHTWSTRGFKEAVEVMEREQLHKKCLRPSCVYEVLAFEEWMYQREGLRPPRTVSPFDKLRAHGLPGILDWLSLLGVTDLRKESVPQTSAPSMGYNDRLRRH